MKAMKSFFFTFLLSGAFFLSKGQSSVDTFFSDITAFNDSSLLTHCAVFIDSNNNTTPSQTLNKTGHPYQILK